MMKANKSKKSIVLFSLIPGFLLGAWTAFNNPEATQGLNPHAEVRVEQIAKPAAPAKKNSNKAKASELFDKLSSGVRTTAELDEDWSSWVGDTKGIKLSELNIPDHRLTMLLTEVRNLASNPYRVLFVHSFASLSEEDAVTLYNRELDGLEEKNLHARIIASQKIAKNKGENLKLDKPYRYEFRLTNNYLKRAYDLRAPRGASEFTAAAEGDFDLVKEVASKLAENETESFEAGTYRTELMIGDKVHDVQLTVRQTDIETLTMDLRVQEVGSLLIRRYALIYE